MLLCQYLGFIDGGAVERNICAQPAVAALPNRSINCCQFVQSAFGLQSMRSIIQYTVLVIMRKQLFYHCHYFELVALMRRFKGAGGEPIDVPDDVGGLMQDFTEKIARLGSVVLDIPHEYMPWGTHLLESLFHLSSPHASHASSSHITLSIGPKKCILDYIMEEVMQSTTFPKGLSEERIEDLLRSTTEATAGAVDSFELLQSVFTSVYTRNYFRENGCTYDDLNAHVSTLSRKVIIRGVFRLAIEMWCLDWNLNARQTVQVLPPVFYGGGAKRLYHPLPATMQLVRDCTGTPLLVLPKEASMCEFVSPTNYNSDAAIAGPDNDSSPLVKVCTPECTHTLNEATTICNTYLSQPHLSANARILVERGYEIPEITLMLTWLMIPSNTIMPFPLLVEMLRAIRLHERFH